MADSLQKLNKTKQKEDDMFAGIIDPYPVEIIKDLPRFFLSVFNWLPILNSQNKTREHKNNIKNTYGTESHSYAGNIKNLDSKPFALTYEGKNNQRFLGFTCFSSDCIYFGFFDRNILSDSQFCLLV